jgi:hypothetical protein
LEQELLSVGSSPREANSVAKVEEPTAATSLGPHRLEGALHVTLLQRRP